MEKNFLLKNGYKCIQNRISFLRKEIKEIKLFLPLKKDDKLLISQMEEEIKRLRNLSKLPIKEVKEQKFVLLPGNSAEVVINDRGKEIWKMVILDGVTPIPHQLSEGLEIISITTPFGKALAGKLAGEKGEFFCEKKGYISFSVKRILLPCESKWIFKAKKLEQNLA